MALSHSDIKLIRSLSQKKFRDSLGLFVVEGEKMVKEALDSSFEVVSVYKMDEIGEKAMSQITLLSSPSPVLAIVKKKEWKDDDNEISGISLALDSVRDPGNFGTIIRISDWFGISKIYCSDDCVDLYNSKTVQSSMGSIFRKRVIYTDLLKVISTYSDSKIPVYGTFLDGQNMYNQELNKKNALIVMGSENRGISAEVASKITNRLLIPSFSEKENGHTSESLNVAIATAIICAEMRR